MFKDLRDFLHLLDNSGNLSHIREELSPVHEIPGVIELINKEVGSAVFFHQVKGYSVPIVANLLGNKKLLSLAFNTSDDLYQEYLTRRETLLKPIIVKDGPVKEVIIKDNIDLMSTLPVLTHHSGDVGPYITSGICIAKHPETGLRRMGLHRIRIKGKDSFSIVIASPGMSRIIQKAEEKGMELEIAIAIGLDPMTFFSSVAFVPEEVDKYELAGALRGGPLEIIPAETIALEVPSRAEFILEGRLIPGLKEIDGPFGDSDGYYHGQSSYVGQIDVITHRKDPIYHALMTNTSEDAALIELTWTPELFRHMQVVFPQIKKLRISMIGFHTVIQIEKMSDKDVSQIIQYFYTLNPYSKLIIVVDTDVDIEDPREIEWAIATRCQPDRDIKIIPEVEWMEFDPSAKQVGDKYYSSIWSIDATKPLDRAERFVRATISPQVMDNIRSKIISHLPKGDNFEKRI
jgi:2,5-furandicarboxylate decarboxylase 1